MVSGNSPALSTPLAGGLDLAISLGMTEGPEWLTAELRGYPLNIAVLPYRRMDARVWTGSDPWTPGEATTVDLRNHLT